MTSRHVQLTSNSVSIIDTLVRLFNPDQPHYCPNIPVRVIGSEVELTLGSCTKLMVMACEATVQEVLTQRSMFARSAMTPARAVVYVVPFCCTRSFLQTLLVQEEVVLLY